MKYLREKSLQIGGAELEAYVQIIKKSQPESKPTLLRIYFDNEKTIGDIKETIYEINKEYPINKQIFQYRGKTPTDTDIFNSIYPRVEPGTAFTVFITE